MNIDKFARNAAKAGYEDDALCGAPRRIRKAYKKVGKTAINRVIYRDTVRGI